MVIRPVLLKTRSPLVPALLKTRSPLELLSLKVDTNLNLKLDSNCPILKVQFSKNTHKPDIFTVSSIVKRVDVSMPILKVSPGQDLETQLQKKLTKSTKSVPEVVSAQCPLVLLVY